MTLGYKASTTKFAVQALISIQQIDVSFIFLYASVLFTDDELRHKIVKLAVEPRA